MTELPTLRGERVCLRPLTDDDVEALVALLAEPSIGQWWGDVSDLDAEREGFRNDGAAFAIDAGGEFAGWLAFNEETDADYRSASLDIALAPAFQGSRLGPEALRLAIDWLVGERGHHRFTIDPALANERAIRVYEAVGFKPVGVLRSYHRAADGTWRDGLLMDLLADERR